MSKIESKRSRGGCGKGREAQCGRESLMNVYNFLHTSPSSRSLTEEEPERWLKARRKEEALKVSSRQSSTDLDSGACLNLSALEAEPAKDIRKEGLCRRCVRVASPQTCVVAKLPTFPPPTNRAPVLLKTSA